MLAMNRRELAQKKIDEWLAGVSEEGFVAALEALVESKAAAGEYVFKRAEDRQAAIAGARRFFAEFSRKIIVLSDGRCVYFAPDPRAKRRNADNAVSWAEYAFHAVSNGGAKIPGKTYNERWYNPYKIVGFELLESTLMAERCVVRLNATSRFDAIMFDGGLQTGMRYRVVTRLDEFGNMDANLTEVTFEASSKVEKKTPRLVSLAEAVQAVVHHQIATGSNPSDKGMIPQSVPTVNEAPVAKATKRILHIVPGLNEPWNGISGAAKAIAKSQGADIVDTRQFLSSSSHSNSELPLSSYDEIWVHSNWWWPTIKACRKVLKAGVPLVRMTHANLDPLRLRSKGWKKKPIWWLVERRLTNRAARVVVTCEAERVWCEKAGVKSPFEILDLKKFYRFDKPIVFPQKTGMTPIHVLYLGRPHPLKGVKYLELAVADLNYKAKSLVPGCDKGCIDLKIVSNTYGEELEKIWQWTDVLVLPTLSENFGRVVAEALEHGKPVITTDGAPAWRPAAAGNSEKGIVNSYGGRLLYLKGYRDGSEETRVKLLTDALKWFVD